MSYFQIGFPDINGRASAITPSHDYDSDCTHYNLTSKERHHVAKLATAVAVGTHYVEYDLGSGNTSSCDFVYIARADLLKAASVTQVRLYGTSTSYGAASYTDTGFASATLYGPRSQDYIATFATTTAYRKWKLDYTYSGSTTLPRSKEWYGTLFDMGKNPGVEIEDIGSSDGMFAAASGAEYFARTDETKSTFRVTWVGVTDAKIVSFFDSILEDESKTPVFLYTTGYHHLLDDKRIVMCRIAGEPSNRKVKNDWNELTVNFEEILG